MDSNETQYASLQGIFYLAIYGANGVLGPYQDLGNMSALTVSYTFSKNKHKESRTGKRGVDKVFLGEKEGTLTGTMENFKLNVMRHVTQSDITEVAVATVTDKSLPAGLKVGDITNVGAIQVTDLELEDANGVPLVEGYHYQISSAAHGSLRILELKTSEAVPALLVQPFKAAFSSGAARRVDVMSGSQKKCRFRFEGWNTADEVWKALLAEGDIQIDPLKSFALIGPAEAGNYELNAEMLLNIADGGFTRITEIDPV